MTFEAHRPTRVPLWSRRHPRFGVLAYLAFVAVVALAVQIAR